MSSISYNDRIPPGWAEWHDHPQKEFLVRHRLEVQKAIEYDGGAIRDVLLLLVRRIADTRNLWIAYHHLKAFGGHAPGPDGLTYSDLSETDIWSMMRMRERIRS